MVKKCYVLNCPTGRKSCKEKHSLFKAPKDEDLLEKWRHSIPQKKSKVFRDNDYVCERHFEPKCVISRWQPSGIGDYFVDNIRSKLTPNAVPTLFQGLDKNDPGIEKYVPEPKYVIVPKNNADDGYMYVDVEVSDSDYVPICFNCLVGSCCLHAE